MTDATTDGPTANHSYPSRPDLTNAVAVVVGAPSFVYPRGGHTDAMGTWRDATDDTAERFEPLLREFVALVDSSTPLASRPDGSRVAATVHLRPARARRHV